MVKPGVLLASIEPERRGRSEGAKTASLRKGSGAKSGPTKGLGSKPTAPKKPSTKPTGPKPTGPKPARRAPAKPPAKGGSGRGTR